MDLQIRLSFVYEDLIHFFESSFIGSDTIGVAKPDAKPLLEAINRLEKNPEDVLALLLLPYHKLN